MEYYTNPYNENKKYNVKSINDHNTHPTFGNFTRFDTCNKCNACNQVFSTRNYALMNQQKRKN
jgi:hypothetical protein